MPTRATLAAAVAALAAAAAAAVPATAEGIEADTPYPSTYSGEPYGYNDTDDGTWYGPWSPPWGYYSPGGDGSWSPPWGYYNSPPWDDGSWSRSPPSGVDACWPVWIGGACPRARRPRLAARGLARGGAMGAKATRMASAC